MSIIFLNSVISKYGTFFTSVFIFRKAINHNPSMVIKAFSVLWCMAWAFIDASNFKWLPPLMVRPLFCAATIIFVWIFYKAKIDTAVSAFLLAYGCSYVLFYMVAAPIGLIVTLLLGVNFPNDQLVNFNNPIHVLSYSIGAILQFLIAYRFFKIKRFKRGFPFLSGWYAVAAALVIAGTVLGIVSLLVALRGSGTHRIVAPLVAAAIIVGAGILIWIRRRIKVFYMEKVEKRNEDRLQQELDKMTRLYKQECDINETMMMENHSLSHRLAAMERSYARSIEDGMQYVPAEIAEKWAADVKNVRKLAREYQENINRVKAEIILPPTNVQAIDDLFALFAERFADNEIEFALKVKGNVNYMTEHVIQQSKLETMIGDHLQDALMAVKASEGSFRNVKVTIGKIGEHYEFTVYDSGIPFEIDTLIRLGTNRVTTHANKGGSGVGFMKTFETMRTCAASLIIRENKGGAFSKSVTICFNGLSRYIIDTYRPEDFPLSDRYTVIGHS